MKVRLMVAGGGTGGHVFPGIAVADALARRAEASVCWVGTARGIEARVLPTTPYAFETMELSGLNGVRGRALVGALGKLPRAAVRAVTLVRAFRPDVVLGVGGYAGGPLVAAAALLRVPTAVLEPNAIPGMTNRLLARFVRRAYLTHEEAAEAFPPGVSVVTGSPVRRAFLARMASPVPLGGVPELLVLGGSQGARALNHALPAAFAALRAKGLAFVVTHQTGAAAREDVAREYARLDLPADVVPFIDDVASVMARASLVVCRAGAMTVAELGVLGRPALYIPLPTAADDHQRKNAEAMTARGAARWIAQSELTERRLAETLEELLRAPDTLAAMGAAAWSYAQPGAAGAIADDLLALSGVARDEPAYAGG